MKNRASKRLALYATQNGLCFKCHRSCVLANPSKRRPLFTIDHVLPKCLGGSNSVSNLVGMCERCNTRKAGHMPSPKMLGNLVKRNRRATLPTAPERTP